MRSGTLKKKSLVNKLGMEQIAALVKLKSTVDKKEKEDENEHYLKEGKEKKRRFRSFTDNGKDKLHEARFLALPSKHPKSWYKKVPIKRSPFIKSRTLDYSGTHNAVSDFALKRINNRGKPVQLKHFYSGNLNVSSKQTEVRKVKEDRIETSFDLAWADPTSMSQIQEALINYACLLQAYWPTDFTGLMMMRLMIKYKWLAHVGESKKAELACKLFEDVARQNASRALNKEEPLSFEQQEEVLKSILIRNNVRPEVPIDEAANKWQQNKYSGNKYNGGGGPKPSFTKNRPLQTAKAKDGRGLCYGFNDMQGGSCRNTKSGDGCKKADGLQLAHLCSFFNKTKQEYCLGNHARKNHK